MKTLNEIINLRQHKYDKDIKNNTYTMFYQVYMNGWYYAYQDLKEILEQNGFNTNVIVMDNT